MVSPGHSVLIADDDRLVRESLTDAFDGFGWRVCTADCGSRAIQVLERNSLDLLVSDVDMPDMSGFQLLTWVRGQAAPRPAVVLMSARADDDLGRTAIAEGAVTLLAKPVGVERMHIVVSTLFH